MIWVVYSVVVTIICIIFIYKSTKVELKNYKQTTFCYCPECELELVKNGILIRDEEVVEFSCPNCKTISEWYFHTPTPLVIRWTTRDES